jgi:hypothetical protein
MEYPVPARAIEKLASAGEKAGFNVEQMILILSAGVSVETLMDIIEPMIEGPKPQCDSSRWIM